MNPVCITNKTEISDVKLNAILNKLPELLDESKKEHCYLIDIGKTQVFSWIFNEEGMIII